MNTQELRVGNLVNNAKNEIIREQFWGTPKVFQIVDFNFLSYYEPIPLTEEWLLKLGFKEDKEVGEDYFVIDLPCDTDTGAELGIQIENDDVFSSTAIFIKDGLGYEYRWMHLNADAKCVHQLQNLYFALTGKELTL